MSTLNGRRSAPEGGEWITASRVRDQFGGDPFGQRSASKRGGRASTLNLELLGQQAKSAGGWLASMLDASGLSYGGSEHISRPFEEDGWVHACLKTIATAVREVPLRFWAGNPATDDQAMPLPGDHPLPQLFARPNPSMSAATFREAGVLHRKLDGEDFWLLYDRQGRPWDGQGLPAAIHPVRGRAMEAKRDKRGHAAVWRVQVHGGSQEFPASAVVQFRDYDPDNPLRGLGDVDVLLRDLEVGYQAQRYMEAVVRNSGDPGGFIKIKGAVNRDERAAMEEEAEQAFGPSQRGRWKILEGEDAEYKPNPLSPRDMEFAELFAWIRDKTASILGVPLPVVGVLDHATYSNYAQAVQTFWKGGNGIIPYLRTVEDGINSHFLPRIRGVERVWARFDTSQIEALQQDKGDRIETAAKLKERFPELSLHEVAALVGLEIDEVEVGDLRLVPSGWTTLAAVTADAELLAGVAEPDPEDPLEELEPEELDMAAELEERASEDLEGEDSSGREERAAYWRDIEERVFKPGEASVAKVYRKWSKLYEAAQIKRLESYAKNGEAAKAFEDYRRRPYTKGSEDTFTATDLTDEDIAVLLLNQEEWALKMEDVVAGPLESIFGISAGGLADEMGAISIDIQDPQVLGFLARQRIQLTEGHTSTLAARVRSAILRVFAGNENTATLQEHVRDQLPALTDELRRVFGTREARALAIARTETAHASNGARFMQMAESGVQTTVWITSGDEHVRGAPGQPQTNHSHYELDGKEVPLGETFARRLKFPSDPDAEAGDVINCRCVTRVGKRTEPPV